MGQSSLGPSTSNERKRYVVWMLLLKNRISLNIRRSRRCRKVKALNGFCTVCMEGLKNVENSVDQQTFRCKLKRHRRSPIHERANSAWSGS